MSFLARALNVVACRLPAWQGVRRRPASLAYAADECPPGGVLLTLALQHVATAIALMAYALIAARMAGLGAEETQSLLAATLLTMALGTALQAWGGRLGSGTLLVHMPNPVMIGLMAAAMTAYGVRGIAVPSLLFAVLTLCMAPLMRHTRALFPPAVVGTVICMTGVAIIQAAVKASLGVDDGDWRVDGGSTLVSAVTFITIMVLSVWGGRLQLIALLLSILAGTLVAAATGQMPGAIAALRSVPLLALPDLPMPVLAIDPGLLVAVALLAALTSLDVLGSVIIMDKMDDDDWRRAQMESIGGGIRALGLSSLFGSLLSAFPTSISSANIGLAFATRSTSRMLGLATGALMAVLAFLPLLTMALIQIPAPVLGAIALYAACFLILSGMEMIASRAMDSRSLFAVGLSMIAGMAVMQMPELVRELPPSLGHLVGDGFVLSGVLVIVLNLLFRIGTKRLAEATLESAGPGLHAAIIAFVERQGAAWGARRVVVQRAALAAQEAVESIIHDGRSVTAIRGFFDEFNLDIELVHAGAPLAIDTAQTLPDAARLLDDDVDDGMLDAALGQVTGRLLHHLADRVSVGRTAGQSWLRLHFEH